MYKFLGIFLISMIPINQTISQTNITTTTTYYLIRHAEKVRTNPADVNPDLNERGYLRAENWKKVFQHISFDAVYATNFIRTLKTIEPIAISNELEIQLYHPTKIDIHQFKETNQNKNVLIVGHSNTIPQFVNQLINQEKYLEMDDAEFSHLYIVTIQDNKITDQLLYVDF